MYRPSTSSTYGTFLIEPRGRPRVSISIQRGGGVGYIVEIANTTTGELQVEYWCMRKFSSASELSHTSGTNSKPDGFT